MRLILPVVFVMMLVDFYNTIANQGINPLEMDKSVIKVGFQKYQSGFQGNQGFLRVLNKSEGEKQSQQ